MEVGGRRTGSGSRAGTGEWAVDGVEGSALKSQEASLAWGMNHYPQMLDKTVLSCF